MHDWGPADGKPLLCLHGITSWGGRFRHLAETRLTPFHVFAPDLRGHGVSDWEPPWNLGAHVGDLVDTLDALHIERTDVVGHSFGGRLALELAARHPERVGRMVLLDPAVWAPPHIALERAELAREDVSYASVEEAIAERLRDGHGQRRAPRTRGAAAAPAARRRRRWRGRYAPSAVVAATARWRRRRRSTASARPTLLIRGRDSEVVPRGAAGVRLRHDEPCRSVTVPGGHIVHVGRLRRDRGRDPGFLQDSRA